jgi:hypothetical protein
MHTASQLTNAKMGFATNTDCDMRMKKPEQEFH